MIKPVPNGNLRRGDNVPDLRPGKNRKTRRTGKNPGGITGSLWRFGRQKYTIMLVPHTEKRTVHFQVSLFTLFFMAVMFLGLLAGFFWFSLDFSGKEVLLASRSRDLVETEASLDIIRDEVGQLVSSAGAFKNSLNDTMDILGLEGSAVDSAAGGGDLSSLFAVEQTDGNTLAEVADLQALRVSLDDSVSSLDDIGMVLSSQKDLLSDIPTIWPLQGVRGWVTQVFGPSIHPFGKYWYLHRGVDLAFGYGVPIMATANGKIIKKDFDANGFGNYLDIQHKYGFKTRYAHMQRQFVEVGQIVSQGEVIGTMGSTGQSTGPHLHYEVMIGTQLVDPIKFLNMANPDGLDNITTSLQRYQ
ncbi:MAG: peptidase M23 [Spirochaetes bacterium]|nr:MAG: peptidase M23 [Spirochaetota bacterium]RKX97328.1 MAG: peptidase M23 [Spirochaetota bacterium]